MFTALLTERYEVLLTTPTGIYNLNLKPWTSSLEAELAADNNNDEEAGIGFRVKVLLESAQTAVSHLTPIAPQPDHGINAAIA
ncbi:hypothetical protein LTR53_019918, partial [Teratosphaeriaceae sp. CCFEE 6253]